MNHLLKRTAKSSSKTCQCAPPVIMIVCRGCRGGHFVGHWNKQGPLQSPTAVVCRPQRQCTALLRGCHADHIVLEEHRRLRQPLLLTVRDLATTGNRIMVSGARNVHGMQAPPRPLVMCSRRGYRELRSFSTIASPGTQTKRTTLVVLYELVT